MSSSENVCQRCNKTGMEALKEAWAPHQMVCLRCWEKEQISMFCRQMGVRTVTAYVESEPLKEQPFLYHWQGRSRQDK